MPNSSTTSPIESILWSGGKQEKYLFDALATLKPDDLNKTVFIRQQELTVMDAIGGSWHIMLIM